MYIVHMGVWVNPLITSYSKLFWGRGPSALIELLSSMGLADCYLSHFVNFAFKNASQNKRF